MGFHPQQKVDGTLGPDLLKKKFWGRIRIGWLGSGAISESINEAGRGGPSWKKTPAPTGSHDWLVVGRSLGGICRSPCLKKIIN